MAFEADCGASTVLVCSPWRAQPGFSYRENVWRPGKSRIDRVTTVTSLYCGPRDEALRDSATPTRGSGWKMQSGVRNSTLITHNSKLLPGGGRSAFRIPNSEFRIQNRCPLSLPSCPVNSSILLSASAPIRCVSNMSRGLGIRRPRTVCGSCSMP